MLHQPTYEIVTNLLFLCPIMVVGICGNVLVCFVYFRPRSAFNLLLFVIAVVDLITCLISIPVQMISDIHGSSFFICITKYISVVFCTITSFNLLTVVAVSRYRSICTPTKTQVTLTSAKVLVLVSVLTSACFATPPAFIIDYNEHLEMCVFSGSYEAKCFFIALLIPGVCESTSLLIVYPAIWKRLRVQKTFRERAKCITPTNVNHGSSVNNTHARESDEEKDVGEKTEKREGEKVEEKERVKEEIEEEENGNNCLVECVEDLPPPVAGSETDSSNFTEMKVSLPKPRRTLHAPTVDKTTRMMLLVTVIFIVSMLPALVIGVVHGGNPSPRFKGAKRVLYNILYMSHFLNSALNPIIYAICSQNFKNLLKIRIQRLVCCKATRRSHGTN